MNLKGDGLAQRASLLKFTGPLAQGVLDPAHWCLFKSILSDIGAPQGPWSEKLAFPYL